MVETSVVPELSVVVSCIDVVVLGRVVWSSSVVTTGFVVISVVCSVVVS